MNTNSTAGIASTWSAARADTQQQAVQYAALKQEAAADRAVATMVAKAVEDTRPAPPPPGQGRHVDRRA